MSTASIAPSSRVFRSPPIILRSGIAAASMLLLAACSSSDSTPNNPTVSADTYAYTASRSSDFGSGRIDRISLSDGNTVDGSYPATTSDIAVTSDGNKVYQIGRFGLDSLTRFDAADTSLTDYQYSVNDETGGRANPQSLAFLNESKAYLTRRGSTELWIIDPAAESEEAFKIGGIDLSAYDTDLPNMTDALIVDDKLFVIVERLNELPSGFQIPDKSAYLVVIDTSTDSEIETNQNESGLPGIELTVRNPTALQYNASTDEIYVVGRGNFFENEAVTDDFHSGGIEAIDPDTYETQLLIDDGTDADNQGYFVDATVINENLGYLLTYQTFGVTTVRTFNPTTGMLSDDVIPELQNVDVTVMAEGPDNHLWVGLNNATPGFMRIDLATQEIAGEMIATELIPTSVAFIDIAAQ